MASAMTDLKTECKTQLKRLAHLEGFPKHTEAVADYICALEVAGSNERVTAVVDEFVQAESIDRKCPTAAMLRRVAYDKREREETTQRNCSKCGGSGVVTVWELLTYRGNSFVVDKREQLDLGFEAAMNFARELAESQAANPQLARQTVNSAARDCACRRRRNKGSLPHVQRYNLGYKLANAIEERETANKYFQQWQLKEI